VFTSAIVKKLALFWT